MLPPRHRSRLSIVLAMLLTSFTIAASDFLAPHYVIDLDHPPAERWAPLLQEILEIRGWNATLKPIVQYMLKYVPMEDWKDKDMALQAFGLGLFGWEYFEEIRGVHVVITRRGYGDHITKGMLVFFQLFYELAMECTGILAQPSSNRTGRTGPVVHARNMDIGLPVGNITVQMTWMKGGKELLETTQYVGYLGVHTGMRKGAWSVQANQRIILEPQVLGGWQKTVVSQDVLALLELRKPVGYLLRETLLAATTFEDAVTALSQAKSVSPLYLVLAGAGLNEGAVLTRNRDGLARNNQSVRFLSDQVPALVQTNWDSWIPIDKAQCLGAVATWPTVAKAACARTVKLIYGDPSGCEALCGLTSDGRAEAARAALGKLGTDKFDAGHLFEVLSQPPVLASTTQFTSLMEPRTNYYQTVVRTHFKFPTSQNTTARLHMGAFMRLFA
eukprot:CAMPEP_0179026046 /NCGR_PEP_ID=MMETSP0796-20121207/8311_1 /TAXON_ID=73915 /ORGANISM="Pyrodinium bahamense, Strain pbaha01" /LENGTH=442 /DNA_ID=CAMNT_0020722111 /DNA_START=45 /DNA_END=1368 /DNA_ORIENTATION=+